ncbi:MAG: hypothetical protein D6695_06935 [Planctomycetota bacterium]|nr:MAG: hypothetical protein D6695_06935 [Planctomycetota bacterium]
MKTIETMHSPEKGRKGREHTQRPGSELREVVIESIGQTSGLKGERLDVDSERSFCSGLEGHRGHGVCDPQAALHRPARAHQRYDDGTRHHKD